MRDRKSYLGSSDAISICDRSKWLDLYKIKMGISEPPDLSDEFKVQLGAYTEPFHLTWLKKMKPELKFSFDNEDGEQHHCIYNYSGDCMKLGSTPDAIIKGEEKALVEVKHCGAHYRNTDNVIQFYMPQLQHHLMCWGLDNILFSAIIGNQNPVPTWVKYSEEWGNWYIEECKSFSSYIKSSCPPPELSSGNEVPTPVRNSVLINEMKQRDVSSSNQIRDMIARINVLSAGESELKEVKAEMKDQVLDSDSMIFIPELFTYKRNAKGTPVLRIIDKEYGL